MNNKSIKAVELKRELQKRAEKKLAKYSVEEQINFLNEKYKFVSKQKKQYVVPAA
ncbi:MAG: hypothetical protein HY960_09095 [Ignavibacteriae bacterium]|nr:hypothetical protein [Ignavibacteriota bacterium]